MAQPVYGGAHGGTVFSKEANDAPLFAMPLQIFDWADRPQEAFLDLAATGIIVLLVVLILMNLVAIILRNKFSRRW